MKKIFAALTTATACAFSVPAMAQDEAEDKSGFRVEALAGWDRVDISLDEETDFEGNDSALFYGAAVGYDFSTDRVLVGIDAEIGTSGNGDEETVSGLVIDGSVYDGTISVEDGLNWYVGGRVGTWMTDNTAVYGKVGYASATVDVEAEGTVDGTPASDSADLDFSGFRFGVGVEQRFGSSAFAKIEYRYTDYTEGEVDYQGQTVDLGEVLEFVDLERHQILAGIGFRF